MMEVSGVATGRGSGLFFLNKGGLVDLAECTEVRSL